MTQQTPIRRPRSTEEGYILIGVLFLLALFIIAMAVAAPKIAADIQRDRDLETMERGKQYIRAIQLYYRKFNAYPPNVDALVKTNEIRFLRRKYIDPTTGKDDWKPVLFGQNKTPLAMGFFGQPLGGVAGMTIAGTGPSGGNGVAGGGMFGGMGQNPNGGTAGGISPGGSIFGTSDPAAPTGPGTGTGTATGQTGSGTGQQTDANGTPLNNGPTIGGMGIVGFSPASPKQSILVYKKKNHYNEWEFTYTPAMDMQMMGGGNTGTIGQPVGGQGTGFGGTNGPGFGGTNGPGFGPGGGQGFGPGGNNGSNPIAPSPTPTPQQPQQ